MMEWQPIETAPKDGTSVLTYPHYNVTHYATDEVYPSEGWVIHWDEVIDAYITMRLPPTHWMPLPPPPPTQ